MVVIVSPLFIIQNRKNILTGGLLCISVQDIGFTAVQCCSEVGIVTAKVSEWLLGRRSGLYRT